MRVFFYIDFIHVQLGCKEDLLISFVMGFDNITAIVNETSCLCLVLLHNYIFHDVPLLSVQINLGGDSYGSESAVIDFFFACPPFFFLP